jgi:hypothetical protein
VLQVICSWDCGSIFLPEVYVVIQGGTIGVINFSESNDLSSGGRKLRARTGLIISEEAQTFEATPQIVDKGIEMLGKRVHMIF